MRTVGQFITHVSTQLNDQRPGRAFTRWGRGLLLEYLNLGIAEISTYRPEAFAKDKELLLKAGASQSVEASETLLSITSNIDGTPINQGDIVMATAFNSYKTCDSLTFKDGKPNYNVKSYSIDKSNDKKFYVDPPVPNGVTAKIIASVADQLHDRTLQDWDKDVDVSTKFAASLVDFMLACAYGLDQESPQSRARSDALYRKFYDVMGVKYRQESKYRSGYYLGKVGTGDPQAGAR